MKFYLCSLPLCLFSILALFAGGDGQFQKIPRLPVNRIQNPKRYPLPQPISMQRQMPDLRPMQRPLMPNQRPMQRPNQRPMLRPNKMPNQRPMPRVNPMLMQRPNQMPHQRPMQRTVQRGFQGPGNQNNQPKKCQLKGHLYNIGTKMISDCQICTCLQSTQVHCITLNCQHCKSYQSLHANPCCIQRCTRKGMPVEFQFEEGVDDEDEKVGTPTPQESSSEKLL